MHLKIYYIPLFGYLFACSLKLVNCLSESILQATKNYEKAVQLNWNSPQVLLEKLLCSDSIFIHTSNNYVQLYLLFFC